MKQQQVCLQEATKIITHRLVRTGRHFRYVILRHSPDLAWLSSHPMSLSKLALFLVEAMRLTKKSALPLVLAAFQHQSQLYQVVATNGIQGEERKPNSVSRKSKRRNFGANANGLNEDGIDVDSDEESEEDGYDTPLRFRK